MLFDCVDMPSNVNYSARILYWLSRIEVQGPRWGNFLERSPKSRKKDTTYALEYPKHISKGFVFLTWSTKIRAPLKVFENL